VKADPKKMRAAVIDVGSNSIKLLVADRGADGRLVEVASRTIESRISKGIGSDKPHLSPEGMERGIAAIASLAAEAKSAGADRTSAVATSAVRDASNGRVFVRVLKAATGLGLRILAGPEEASLIGRGLTTDPSLISLRNFHAYDLGGGSLECLSFKARNVERAESLPLGCVRMTEMFVSSPSEALGDACAYEIGRHVKETLLKSGFPLPVAPGSGVVGTGGTLTTVRQMVAVNRDMAIEDTSPMIGVTLLHEVLARIAPLGLDARKMIPGLPPERADVFPAALVTLLALAELGGIQAFHHSFRNLRWGVAAELLG
jgi:exopolyphosphatase / guanosine-5'-triphosphate,3'-diphosphate pyrophosphatase